MPVKNMAGIKMGRLEVVEQAATVAGIGTYWLCKCSCGKLCEVLGISIRKGNTKSCGCIKKEMDAEKMRKTRTHGMSKTPIYYTWLNIRNRCQEPKNQDYKDYGARGIKVCVIIPLTGATTMAITNPATVDGLQEKNKPEIRAII